MVQQGGLSINDKKVEDFKKLLEEADFVDNMVLVKKG